MNGGSGHASGKRHRPGGRFAATDTPDELLASVLAMFARTVDCTYEPFLGPVDSQLDLHLRRRNRPEWRNLPTTEMSFDKSA